MAFTTRCKVATTCPYISGLPEQGVGPCQLNELPEHQNPHRMSLTVPSSIIALDTNLPEICTTVTLCRKQLTILPLAWMVNSCGLVVPFVARRLSWPSCRCRYYEAIRVWNVNQELQANSPHFGCMCLCIKRCKSLDVPSCLRRKLIQ